MARVLQTYVALVLVAFVLHLAWENLHLPLYTGYENLGGGLPVTLYATLGDVTYTFLAVLFHTAFERDWFWIKKAKRADYALFAFFGLLVALFVEYKAEVLGLWHYTDAMPIIPVLHVGLSPVLQMSILLPFSIFLTKRISVDKFL